MNRVFSGKNCGGGVMANVNNCTIIGRLGGDPEVRHTQSGKAVCNFSVAVTNGHGDRATTTWFRVVVWGNSAEACGRFLRKGREVFVQGRIQTRKYEARDGGQREAWELVADEYQGVQFLSGREGVEPKPSSGWGGGGGASEAARREAVGSPDWSNDRW